MSPEDAVVGSELTATLTDTEGGVSASGQITGEMLDVAYEPQPLQADLLALQSRTGELPLEWMQPHLPIHRYAVIRMRPDVSEGDSELHSTSSRAEDEEGWRRRMRFKS